MELVLQQLANGLMLGATYALIALGFTLIFGVLGVLNMAHAETMTVAAFTLFALLKWTPLPFSLAILGSVVAGVLVGLVIERIAIRPVSKGNLLAPLITTMAASLMLQNFIALLFGTQAVYVPPSLPAAYISIGPVSVAPGQIAVLAVGLAAVVVLKVFVDSSWMGREIRATSENTEVAMLLGINARRVIVATVALSSVLAAIAGVMVVEVYHSAWAYMGINYGLKGVIVMIIGGVGSMPGAMAAGLLLGFAEVLASAFVSSSYRDAVAFVLLIILLLVRPQGLAPVASGDRA